ncbi:MAG TPA: HlyD family secretion protein [Terriglobia bacterium]|nr:HlyD family secretion protein [Terriglobia bacterium]
MWFFGKMFRVAMTAAMVLTAIVLGAALWRYYMIDPWTRDGTVRANVVSIAPEVSGTVVDIKVVDNQFVHKGDILYVIDPTRFRLALTQAQATAESRKQDMIVAQQRSARRAALSDLAASKEEKEQFSGNAAVAAANYNEAVAEVEIAKVNLERSVIHAPVNGYVTNLLLRQGDYASAGQKSVSVIDSDSFWIAGYFEETKLAQIRRGDVAHIKLMGFTGDVVGHVESLARGITDQNGDSGSEGLETVNPVFTWVRLAQRFPVRIHVDLVPAGIDLAMGMTCTVSVGDKATDLRQSVAKVAEAAKAEFVALWIGYAGAVQAKTVE